MAKKSTEKNIRKITKIGKYSYAVSIPISVIRAWKWQERQKVILETDNKKKLSKLKTGNNRQSIGD